MRLLFESDELFSQAELYFFEDRICSPNGYYSPKNELEALNSVISLIDGSVSKSTKSELVRDSLQALRMKVAELLNEFGNKDETETRLVKSSSCDKEDELVSWAESKGMQNRLQIARKCPSFTYNRCYFLHNFRNVGINFRICSI